MNPNAFLPLFITEQIYLVGDVKTKKDPTFLGGNKKGVLILISNPGASFLSEDQDALLRKILLSVELNYDDVAIVNLANSGFEEVHFQKALSFGAPVKLQSDYYHVNEKDGKQWLLVDDLTVIAQDRNRKKRLWEHLQLLFPD